MFQMPDEEIDNAVLEMRQLVEKYTAPIATALLVAVLLSSTDAKTRQVGAAIDKAVLSVLE